MIPVGLLTTWDEKCGVAEFSRHMVQAMDSNDIQYKVIPRQPNGMWDMSCVDLWHMGVIHVNYEPGLFNWVTPRMVQSWRAKDIKTVLELNTSHDGDNSSEFTRSFDRVIVHEKTTEGFVHIPHGISDHRPVKAGGFYKTLGTAGFPFPWKGFHQVAQASAAMGKRCMVIAPESHHFDTDKMREFVMAANPNTHYRSDWLQEEAVIDLLGMCQVNVFAYTGGNYGISGAVRLGLASGRPLVATRSCRQFRDLLDYEDEIEFCESQHPGDIVAAVERVIANGKMPKRILEDQSWSKVIKQYSDVYHSLF